MNDLISRQAAIDAMEESKTIYHDRKVIIGKMQDIVNNLPPVQEQQWIPVTERLPDKPGKYLVTVQNGNVYAGTYDKFSKRFQCAAVAWMPLPAAYKGES